MQSMDQGFFVAGNISSHTQLFGSKDVFISKLDRQGKLIKTTVIGGKGLDEVSDMTATEDGGVLLAVYSTSGKTDNKLLKVPEKSGVPARKYRFGFTVINGTYCRKLKW